MTTVDEYNPNGSRAFNQWTRSFNDSCQYKNSLNVSSKPMRYYVNEYNSPQTDPFENYTIIGNIKQYDVRNDFERAIPSRLNPLYQVNVLPYQTTPFLGNNADSRVNANTSTELRFGSNLRSQKSAVAISEVDYNRWDIVDPQTVQNAGNYNVNGRAQPNISRNGEFDPHMQNNVLFMNSSVPWGGISTRSELRNYVDLKQC